MICHLLEFGGNHRQHRTIGICRDSSQDVYEITEWKDLTFNGLVDLFLITNQSDIQIGFGDEKARRTPLGIFICGTFAIIPLVS